MELSLRSSSLKKVVDCLSETDKDEIEKITFPKDLWLLTFRDRINDNDCQFIFRCSELEIQNLHKSKLFRSTFIKYNDDFTFNNKFNEYLCLICGDVLQLPCKHFGMKFEDFDDDDWKRIYTITMEKIIKCKVEVNLQKLPDHYTTLV